MRLPCVLVLTAGLVVAPAACSDGSHSQTAATTTPPTSKSTGRLKRPARPNRQAPPATVPHPDGHGATVTVPATIRADCSVDVTSTLQAWLDGTPDDAVIAFPGQACYRIEGTLRLKQRNDLTIEGHGATLRATTVGAGDRLAVRGRAHLLISDSKHIVVRELIVRGANPNAGTSPKAYKAKYEAQHAFSLNADDGVTLDHVQAYDVYGDFVYIGGAGTPSKHVVVKDSKFARSGRQGISVTNGEDVDIAGNNIADVARSLFDLEPNTRAQEARRIDIEHNTTGAVRNFWLANKGSGINIADITVAHNDANAPSGGLVFVYGPAFGKRGPFTFTDNKFQVSGAVTDETATGAFVFVNANNIKISANVLRATSAKPMPAVEVRTTNNVSVTANVFTGTSDPVVADAASRNIRVSPGHVTVR